MDVLGRLLAAQVIATMEAGGPVVAKQRQDEWEEKERASIVRSRERRQQRLAAEAAERQRIRDLTPPEVWARIDRDEKRRADKKAAKKARNKAR
jgi:hypothetical protein